jgi:hypothetical protein
MDITKYYRLMVGFFCSAVSLLFSAEAPFADAATHQLSLKTSSIEGDCGGGTCTPMCSFRAELKNVGHGPSRPVAIYFQYPIDEEGKKAGPAKDGEEYDPDHRSTVALFFRALQAGSTDKTLDEARRVTCENLVVDKIEVSCPEEDHEKCLGFYYVDIPENKVPYIAHQKIEGK